MRERACVRAFYKLCTTKRKLLKYSTNLSISVFGLVLTVM